MPSRDSESLKIEPFADAGLRIDPADASPAVSRSTGYPASYMEVGGDAPELELFQQFWREHSGMLHEINQQGGAAALAHRYRVHPSRVRHGVGRPALQVEAGQ